MCKHVTRALLVASLFAFPALARAQSPTLQTNGTNNSSQSTLNLQSGTGITLTNTSGGNVQAVNTEPLNATTLQTTFSGAPWLLTPANCSGENVLVANGIAGQFTCVPSIYAGVFHSTSGLYINDIPGGYTGAELYELPGQAVLFLNNGNGGPGSVTVSSGYPAPEYNSGPYIYLTDTNADGNGVSISGGGPVNTEGVAVEGQLGPIVSLGDDGSSDGILSVTDIVGENRVDMYGLTGNIVATGAISAEAMAAAQITSQNLGGFLYASQYATAPLPHPTNGTEKAFATSSPATVVLDPTYYFSAPDQGDRPGYFTGFTYNPALTIPDQSAIADYRGGRNTRTSQNWPIDIEMGNSSFDANAMACLQNSLPGDTGSTGFVGYSAVSNCLEMQSQSLVDGWDYGDPGGNWYVSSLLTMSWANTSQGIHNGLAIGANISGPGDTNLLNTTLTVKPAWIAGSDEGVREDERRVTEQGSYAGTVLGNTQGHVPGSASLALTPTNGNLLGARAPFLDEADDVITGSIDSGTSDPTQLGVVDLTDASSSIPISTTCFLTNYLAIPRASNNAATNSATAGLTVGLNCAATPTPGQLASFHDSLFIETVQLLTVSTPSSAPAPFSLTSSPLPPGMVGVAYSATIGVAGGAAPYTCVITAGTLPAGLSLAGCVVSGTPTTASSDTVTIQASDSSGATPVSGPESIAISAYSTTIQKLVFTSPTLTFGTVSVPYSETIGIGGGTAPYTCTITAGTLPAGLSLSGCVASGTPTAAGVSTLTVQVTDSSTPTNTISGPESISEGFNYTTSGWFRFSHQSNYAYPSTVYVGGMVGRYIEMTTYTPDAGRYVQYVFGSPSSSTLLIGYNKAEPGHGYFSYPAGTTGPVAIYHGADVTVPQTPGAVSPNGTYVGISDNDAAWTIGAAVENTNHISALLAIDSHNLTVNNPFAAVTPILGYTLNGIGAGGGLTSGTAYYEGDSYAFEFNNTVPDAKYVTNGGLYHPLNGYMLRGKWASGLTMAELPTLGAEIEFGNTLTTAGIGHVIEDDAAENTLDYNYNTSEFNFNYPAYGQYLRVNGSPVCTVSNGLCSSGGASVSAASSARIAGSLVTTAGMSDNVTIPGMTTNGHCTFSPTNASASTASGSYISGKAAGLITFAHAATAGMTYDFICTSN